MNYNSKRAALEEKHANWPARKLVSNKQNLLCYFLFCLPLYLYWQKKCTVMPSHYDRFLLNLIYELFVSLTVSLTVLLLEYVYLSTDILLGLPNNIIISPK